LIISDEIPAESSSHFLIFSPQPELEPRMIFLIGHRGYIGSAFARALDDEGIQWKPFPFGRIGGASFGAVMKILREERPSLLINAAGFTGRPNVDACESKKGETIEGNLLLPIVVANACAEHGIPWGHVSSGCIYDGAKLRNSHGYEVVTDLLDKKVRRQWAANPPELHGFSEDDPPNFTFESGTSSFYSGVKALAESSLNEIGGGYVWRIRMPFDHLDHPRNYLTKLQTYPRLYDNINSLSHRGESVQTCLRMALRRAPYGIYNVVNSGYVSTRQIVAMLVKHFKVANSFRFWKSDRDFYRKAAKARRSNCLLDTSKLDQIGLGMRNIEEALLESMELWVTDRVNFSESHSYFFQSPDCKIESFIGQSEFNRNSECL